MDRGGERSFECIEPEASLRKILPVISCVHFEGENLVLITSGPKRKFFPVWNILDNPAYTITNARYIDGSSVQEIG